MIVVNQSIEKSESHPLKTLPGASLPLVGLARRPEPRRRRDVANDDIRISNGRHGPKLVDRPIDAEAAVVAERDSTAWFRQNFTVRQKLACR